MDHSPQQFTPITSAICIADSPVAAPSSFDWAALRALREQRVAIQTKILERRVDAIMQRHLQRELEIAALNIPALPLAPDAGARLGHRYRCPSSIASPSRAADIAIVTLQTASETMSGIVKTVERLWDRCDAASHVLDMNVRHCLLIGCELQTLWLYQHELKLWKALADEHYLVRYPVLNTPQSLVCWQRHLESECWGWEDGNLDHVIACRGDRMIAYACVLETEMFYSENDHSPETLRNFSAIADAVAREHQELRELVKTLQFLRKGAR